MREEIAKEDRFVCAHILKSIFFHFFWHSFDLIDFCLLVIIYFYDSKLGRPYDIILSLLYSILSFVFGTWYGPSYSISI